jgi:branched-chain amino acid transport system ATP-binding protein
VETLEQARPARRPDRSGGQMTAMLELENIRAGYNDAIAIEDISLTIGQGEVVCLLGANGAGKTTTMRVVTGLIPLLSGTVRYNGEDISQMPTHDRVTAGICLSPEGRQVFPDLTVMENLSLGSFNRRARPNRKQTLDQVLTLFPKLAERGGQAAGLMSGGEQQMLAIGRALMGQPKLLALDEPSLGLSPKMVSTVFESIQTVARSGITILLVEQNTRAALSIAQRGYVLSAGRVVHEGTATDLAQSEMVQKAFVGAAFTRQSVRKSRRERRLAESSPGGADA